MLKLSFFIFIIYSSAALALSVVGETKYFYREFCKENVFLIKFLTIFLQPFMNVIGNGKVTHSWHFRNTECNHVDKSIALHIYSDTQQKRNFRKGFPFILINALADLGWVQEAAIVKPFNYDGKWSLVFLDKDSGICQESILLHEGAVKILVDGNVEVWGKSETESIICLQLVKLIKVNNEKNVLFI